MTRLGALVRIAVCGALTFVENHVEVVVFEGVSQSGGGDAPMYLRASYPADVKKTTLVHE